jgi:hypothetical protein
MADDHGIVGSLAWPAGTNTAYFTPMIRSAFFQ